MQLRSNDAFPGVGVGYALPGLALRPYVSTISCIEVADAAGTIIDWIYPEWGNVRFASEGQMMLRTGAGPLEDCTPASGIGPTSHATRFSLSPGRYWSISLTPLGWARFVGTGAAALAERWQKVEEDGAFAAFAGISAIVAEDDPARVIAGIDAHLGGLPASPVRDADRILAVHDALIDPAVTSVGELADRAGLEPRTLQRLAASAFGFRPILLIRRQRFLRSLALYMLDPSLSWIDTLDTQYHDQAHFIRDFRRFMDMTPGQYGKLPHPVMWAAARARVETAGSVMQVLQAPSPAGRRG